MQVDTERQLTPKQEAYKQGILQGLSKVEAGLRAGYTPAMAQNATTKIETPAVQESLRQAMERVRINSDRLARKIDSALDAKTVLRETQFAEREVVEDHTTQLKAVELAAKLRGDLDSAQVSVTFNQAIMNLPEGFAERYGLVETPDVIDVTPQDVATNKMLCETPTEPTLPVTETPPTE